MVDTWVRSVPSPMLLPEGHSAAPPPAPKAASHPTAAFMMEYLPHTVLLAVRFQLILVSKLSLVSRCEPLAKKLELAPPRFATGTKPSVVRGFARVGLTGPTFPGKAVRPAPLALPVAGS